MKNVIYDITAIRLIRLGDHAIVEVEQNGTFVEVIRERYDGAFCHIVEGHHVNELTSRA